MQPTIASVWTYPDHTTGYDGSSGAAFGLRWGIDAAAMGSRSETHRRLSRETFAPDGGVRHVDAAMAVLQ
jgi:hypothetical protein